VPSSQSPVWFEEGLDTADLQAARTLLGEPKNPEVCPLRPAGGEGGREHRLALKRRTQTARRLRRAATEAEKEMWLALRELPTEHRFRRQHPIGSYVVDFACPGRNLAIELDGGQHAQQAEEDVARSLEIARRGYRVIRFWNNDVMHNLAGVLEIIRRELDPGRS
jgi:very-short-patch-repair endonuclease